MLSRQDLENLAAYLDDELSAEQVHRLDQRLARDPEFCDALGQLRLERAFRAAAFASLAPGDLEADQFACAMIGSLRRRDRWRRLAWRARIAGCVAACIFAGFMIGRVGFDRGGAGAPTVASRSAGSGHSLHDARLTSASVARGGSVYLKPQGPGQEGPYQVALLDEAGRVVAVQKFTRIEDARRFAADVGQYEARRLQVQDGRPMLVSDQF